MATANDLQPGETALVLAVAGTDLLGARILEMGVVPGVVITLTGVAPWGDPLELEVCGYRLSLRRVEAARITIERRGEPRSTS